MNIDVSKIENYESMTAEEKVAALEAYNIPENTEKYDRLKKSFDNVASDAASWKKQLREKQSEQERAEAERVEREAQLNAELESLRKEKQQSELITKYMSAGYSQELATKSAAAKINNDTETEFECLHLFIEEQKIAAIKNQPSLSAGQTLSAKEAAEKEKYAMLRKNFGL